MIFDSFWFGFFIGMIICGFLVWFLQIINEKVNYGMKKEIEERVSKYLEEQDIYHKKKNRGKE